MSNFGSHDEVESLPPTPTQKLANKRQEEAAKQQMAEIAAERRWQEDAVRSAGDRADAVY